MADSTHAAQQARAIAAQAWSGLLIIPIAARVTELWQLALQEVEPAVRSNGPSIGVWFFTLATCASALLAVAIRSVDIHAFRRLVYLASVLYLATLLLIQAIDLFLHVRWSGFHVVFSLTHDALALWACWASRRWLALSRASALEHPPTNFSFSAGDA
jgi:hypothetical protein